MAAADIHRDLKLTDPLTEGEDVKALQKACNATAEKFENVLGFHLREDGKLGKHTLHGAIRSAYVLGLSEVRLDEMTHKKLINETVQLKIRHPEERDAEERKHGDKRRDEIKEKREAAQPDLAHVKVTMKAGDPHWGGSNDVVHQYVEPFMVKRGLPIGSGKRTPAENQAIGGSPTSDHLTTQTTTMARDFPTFEGEDDARALARSLGFDAWQPNDFTRFTFLAGGHSWSAQVLWGAAIDHGDHVHVGLHPA